MIVGEPTLMGGDFGDEDERLITRLENSQYDPSLANQMQNQHPALLSRSSGPTSMEDPNNALARMAAAVQHESSIHYGGTPPRSGVISSGHRPPSAGTWQQTRPASVNNSNTPTGAGGEAKNRSPNT